MDRDTRSILEDIEMYKDNDVSVEGKELADAKAYLAIVMRELDESKQQVSYYENLLSRPKKNKWKGFAIFELLVFAAALGVLGTWYVKESRAADEIPQQEEQQYVDTNSSEVTETPTYFKAENLEKLIEEQKDNITGDFMASVETLFGYQYLCFTDDHMKVYYRNEYPSDSSDKRMNVLIDNGARLVEYNWDYDFTDFTNLCPYYGTYSADGTSQLVFPVYEMAEAESTETADAGSAVRIPKELRVVDAEKLWEYASIDVSEEILKTMTTTYSEVISDVGTVTDTRMTLKVNNAEYLFSISKDAYVNAVYYEENILKFTDHFSFEIDEDSITFKGVLYVSDKEYLGEISGSIMLENQAFVMKGFQFAAYVEANQEDGDDDGIIIPRQDILTDYISLYGRKRERFLVPISKVVDKNTVTNDSIKEKDGFKVYYDENGKKACQIGIDVSKYQGEIDWVKVKESGIDYAMIRIGYRGMNEGTLELDPYFIQNIEAANEAGVPVGVYFFSQAITADEVVEEAELVIETLKEYKVSYPVVFDTEMVTTYAARANNLTRQQRTDFASMFCKMVKDAGYTPMIYANTKWMVMGIDLEQLGDYDLWYAYYGDDVAAFPYQFDMLQYSDTGSVPGISSEVDLNISFKNYAE
ncbi:MAG: hypothetical protein E7256_12720 [Lachnospiraceae bacterium]|nr:hypothetical protein [Lachnospiraceae bacterium]